MKSLEMCWKTRIKPNGISTNRKRTESDVITVNGRTEENILELIEHEDGMK